MKLYRLARWWKRWPYVLVHNGMGTGENGIGVHQSGVVYRSHNWCKDGYCSNGYEELGIYRGRAWPRFWLAKVEVAG